MKLINATIRPGEVLEIIKDKDGNFNGNIKVSAPGIFSEEDSTDKLPPVMPFWDMFGSHANTYSKPKVHDEIWLLHLTDNPRQLYWFRKDETMKSNKNISDVDFESENVEIICNREVGADWAAIYFSDGSGWVINKGDSRIQIREDGTILLNTNRPSRVIDINDNCISLGSEGSSAHPAAYGDILTQICQKIQVCLDLTRQAAATNPFTIGISTAIGTIPDELKILNEQINSQHVTLD